MPTQTPDNLDPNSLRFAAQLADNNARVWKRFKTSKPAERQKALASATALESLSRALRNRATRLDNMAKSSRKSRKAAAESINKTVPDVAPSTISPLGSVDGVDNKDDDSKNNELVSTATV